ncbi:hypothetical protein LASUN_15380 [Lentilactobacillus sunkii]|jgi:hypothetical protein|uniref:Uncharacterized protein n=1 Tax=Lentilactobacillus sunkii TaxID=481719 RepID=A0A1E7XDD2_9LACO|nr:hypothetical protein [Lentilactobacillus sunkii]OFA10982.1 hypothetical protein LASUN_15380 [Lentilactobacillus sunkii]
MKKITPKNMTYFFLIYLGVAIIWNLFDHEAPIQDSQYTMIGVWGLGYVTSYLKMPDISFYAIYFVLWMVIERQIGGYYDWTSWIIFALVAVLMTWITNLIRITYASRYNKPKKKDEKNESLK